MSASISNGRVSQEVQTLDGIRPRPAKAVLRDPAQSDAVRSTGPDLISTVEEALMKRYGSLKAVAFELGGIDASQLRREFDLKKFPLARLNALDEAGKAEIGAAILAAFGAALETPAARARRVIAQIEADLVELKQFVEMVA